MADRFPGYPSIVCPNDLPEDEFFSLVHTADQIDWNPDDDPPDLDDRIQLIDQPCSECGEHGACAYDVEGRPLIHATRHEDTDG